MFRCGCQFLAPDLVVVTDWRPDANGYGARALSVSDGSERWRTDGLGQVIALTRDHVFTIAWVEHTHRLCARSLASGETLWTEEGLQFANAAADGTTLVQFAGSGEVRAWDVASGALRWKSSVAAFKGPAREPAVGPSGVLVVDGKKKLHVLDLGSGKPKASVALPTPHVDHALARGEDRSPFFRSPPVARALSPSSRSAPSSPTATLRRPGCRPWVPGPGGRASGAPRPGVLSPRS